LVSALCYSTQWAEPNAFIPGVCFTAAFLAVALPRGGQGERAALCLVSVQLLCSLVVEPRYQPIQRRGLEQGLKDSYVWLWSSSRRPIPTTRQRELASALREELTRADEPPGELFALQRPWWNVLAGGPGHVGSMGVNDLPLKTRRHLQATLRAALAAGHYRVAWFEGRPPRWLQTTIRRHFRLERANQGDKRVRPQTGYMSEAGMVTPYRANQQKYVWTR
jgi:hypothetical protein